MRNFLEELDIKGEYYYYNLSEYDADLKIKDWMLNIFDNLKNVLDQCTDVYEINEKVKCYLFNILSDDDYEKCLKNIRILFFDNKYLDYIEKIVIEVFSEDGHGVKYMLSNDFAPNDRCLRVELFDLEHEDDNTIYLVSPDYHGCLNLMRKIDEIVIDITDGKTVEQKEKEEIQIGKLLLNMMNNPEKCEPIESINLYTRSEEISLEERALEYIKNVEITTDIKDIEFPGLSIESNMMHMIYNMAENAMRDYEPVEIEEIGKNTAFTYCFMGDTEDSFEACMNIYIDTSIKPNKLECIELILFLGDYNIINTVIYTHVKPFFSVEVQDCSSREKVRIPTYTPNYINIMKESYNFYCDFYQKELF